MLHLQRRLRQDFPPKRRYLLPDKIHGIRDSVAVRVTLRLAVYRHSVRLGDKPLETHDQ
jgi:hypothetical protein